jgi:hypothetical protein
VIVADYIVSLLVVCLILGSWPVLFVLLRRGFWTPQWKPSLLLSVMGVLLPWLLMVWLLSRFSPIEELTAASVCYAIVILPYAFIVARFVDKVVKRKRLWVFVLLIYLIFDLRPLLLIPNLLLSRKPCLIYKQESGLMELSVFPRLCIAGDPVQVHIRSHDLPLGGAFQRNYDRSGIYNEFQFSGTVNNARAIETLYWTIGMAGGLEGVTIPEKTIWLGDYVHFDRVGRYRINFRYQDSGDIDYNLGDFSVIYLPENPVSKFIKQTVLTAGMFLPSEEMRVLAVKWLGYQETAYSTYALAKYHSTFVDDMGLNQPHSHSVFETYRGTLRNYHFWLVGKILRPFVRRHHKNPYSLLGQYFHFHCCRLMYPYVIQTNQVSPEVTEAEIGKLIKYTYGGIDPTSRVVFVKTAVHMRDYQTDEYWRTLITKWESQQTQSTNQTEIANFSRRRQYAESQLANKKLRDLRLRLIDYTLASLPEQDRKNAEDGSNTVSRAAKQ